MVSKLTEGFQALSASYSALNFPGSAVGGDLANSVLGLSKSLWNHMPNRSTVLSGMTTVASAIKTGGSAVFSGVRNFSYTQFCSNAQNGFNFGVDKLGGQIKNAGIFGTAGLVIAVAYAVFVVGSFIFDKCLERARNAAKAKNDDGMKVANDAAEALRNQLDADALAERNRLDGVALAARNLLDGDAEGNRNAQDKAMKDAKVANDQAMQADRARALAEVNEEVGDIKLKAGLGIKQLKDEVDLEIKLKKAKLDADVMRYSFLAKRVVSQITLMDKLAAEKREQLDLAQAKHVYEKNVPEADSCGF